jgi:hypothetical protein
MIRTAQLRVYLPLPDVEVGLPPDDDASLRVTETDTRFGLLGDSLHEDGRVTTWQGRRYICPWTPKLRVLEGVLAMRRAYGQLGGGAVIPEDLARSARAELDALRRDHPTARVHILTSAWHVPVRWFVAFDPTERELLDCRPGGGIRYRTAIEQARKRVGTALEVLAGAAIPDTMRGDVEELDEWLEGFPPEAMVEVDYCEVAQMFTEAELALDESAADLWNAITALAGNRWDDAGQHYGSLVYRWSVPMAVSYSS